MELMSPSNYQQLDEPVEFDFEALPESTPLGISMCAGAMAGIMEHTVMYPVDAIKTRMQVASVGVYRGVVESLTRVSATEGAMALWRGMGSVILGAGPAHAVQFAMFEGISNLTEGRNHPALSAFAGATASSTADALMNPFDVIKQRMQLHRGTLLQTAHSIWRKEGFTAFYVSYPTTLLMTIPFAATNFTVYDNMSHFLNPEHKPDPLIHCISGGIAGATAAAVSTPFDVIKTLLQTRGCSENEVARNLDGIISASKFIYREHGVSGFFRGVKPRIIVNMPSTAISWTVYEAVKHYILASSTK